MNPIFDQNDLREHIQRYGWSHDESQWILIILANPNSHSPALREVYSNFIYLDDRTEEVSFILPGYANMVHQVATWYFGDMPWIHGRNGEKLIFDQEAFVRTVRWLESEGYRYSESAELLFLEYMKDIFSPKFDLAHIVSFNLDNLVRNGVNLTAFFKSCNQVVRGKMSLRDLEGKYYLIQKAVGWMLREAGKRDKAALVAWLEPRCRKMPRTMLRYAIEKFPEDERQRFMGR